MVLMLRGPSRPQQMITPSVRNPHVVVYSAVTALKVPSGESSSPLLNLSQQVGGKP